MQNVAKSQTVKLEINIYHRDDMKFDLNLHFLNG